MSSLFTADTLIGATLLSAEDDADLQPFVDLREWHRNHERVKRPPQPDIFSKEALQQRPVMSWLAGVDLELIAPAVADIEWQRDYLKRFLVRLREESIYLEHSFCPQGVPEGYKEPLIAVDTETTGLDTRLRYDYDGRLLTRTQMVGLCLATSPTRSYYLPVRHTGDDGILNWHPAVIAEFMNEIHAQFACIYHNASYDREVLALNGVTVFRSWPYFFDTMVLDYFFDVNQKSHGLKACSKRHLGRTMIEIHELFHGLGAAKTKEYIQFDTLPATTAFVYGASDPLNTYGLFAFYAGQPETVNMFLKQPIPLAIDHKTIDVRRRMCRPGMPISIEYNYYAAKDAIYRAGRTKQFLFELIGRPIELNSPKQISELLFDELKLPPIDENGNPAIRGKNGAFSTGEDILDLLFKQFPDVLVLKYLVLYRKIEGSIGKSYLKNLCNSYMDAVLPYAKVQLSFSQTNVPTGRLSSDSSNGAERVTVKVSDKTKKRSFKYDAGDWTASYNSQGISNPGFRTRKVKKIKALPQEAEISLDSLYPAWVHKTFLQLLAEQ